MSAANSQILVRLPLAVQSCGPPYQDVPTRDCDGFKRHNPFCFLIGSRSLRLDD
jgi:hypothetical protein